MGSGKTTVGRVLAARLGWPLRDSDADIEAREGRTVRELGDEIGVDAMHDLEASHLLEALAAPDPAVVCTAASVIDDERCLAALRDGSLLLAWLTATPETAAARFDSAPHRPRFGADTEAFLARQAADRAPRFRSLGPLEVATDDADPTVLADTIIAALDARPLSR